MEIVSWLTAGTIDTAWPGVSPAIAEYVQGAQGRDGRRGPDPHIVGAGKLFRCPMQGTALDAERAWLEFDTAPYLARAVASLNALVPRPDVTVVTGDLVDHGEPNEYEQLRHLLAPLSMPVFVIPGNHDAREPLREAFRERQAVEFGAEIGEDCAGSGSAAHVPKAWSRSGPPRAVRRSLPTTAAPVREYRPAEAAPAPIDRGWEYGDQWAGPRQLPIADAHRASAKPPQSTLSGHSARTHEVEASAPSRLSRIGSCGLISRLVPAFDTARPLQR